MLGRYEASNIYLAYVFALESNIELDRLNQRLLVVKHIVSINTI